jgi:hypothetical protein
MSDLEGVGLAEYFGFFHRKHGDDGLRQALEFTIDLKRQAGSYEELERIAKELTDTGLLRAGELVAEVLDRAPHIWDCKCH